MSDRKCKYRKCENSLNGMRKHAQYCCRKHKDNEKFYREKDVQDSNPFLQVLKSLKQLPISEIKQNNWVWRVKKDGSRYCNFEPITVQYVKLDDVKDLMNKYRIYGKRI